MKLKELLEILHKYEAEHGDDLRIFFERYPIEPYEIEVFIADEWDRWLKEGQKAINFG